MGHSRRDWLRATIGPRPFARQRSGGHRLRGHTRKSAVNLNAPVHTPQRWGWLPNRMVPAVLEAQLLQDQIAKAFSLAGGSATLGARCSAN